MATDILAPAIESAQDEVRFKELISNLSDLIENRQFNKDQLRSLIVQATEAFLSLNPNLTDYIAGTHFKTDAIKGNYDTPITGLISAAVSKEIASGADVFTAIANIAESLSPPYSNTLPMNQADRAMSLEERLVVDAVKCRHQSGITAQIANIFFRGEKYHDYRVGMMYFEGSRHRGVESREGHYFVELRVRKDEDEDGSEEVAFIDITNPKLTRNESGQIAHGTEQEVLHQLFARYHEEQIEIPQLTRIDVETWKEQTFDPADYT